MHRRSLLSMMGIAIAASVCERKAWSLSAMPHRIDDLVSPADGTLHRLTHAAVGPRPPSGYPLLLLLDGNTSFAPAIAHAQSLGRPLLVAGLGYPEAARDEIIARRYHDLTSAAPDETIPRPAGAPAPRTGGRVAYADFLLNRVMPHLAGSHPLDPSRLILFGHSLGGAFCLHQLYEGRSPFSAFVASDPSIWWNGGELWRHTTEWSGPGPGRPISLSIMTSGRRGQRPGHSAVDARRTADLRSGPGGREVADRLSSTPGLSVVFRDFPDETHGSLMPVAARLAVESAPFGG